MEDIKTDPSDYSDAGESDSDTGFQTQYTQKNKHKHSLQCRHCSQIFFQNDQLMSHIASDHPRVMQPNSQPAAHRITKRKPSKLKKKSCSTPQRPPPEKPPAVFRTKRNCFNHNSMQCRYCFQVFNENHDLMQHISTFHSDSIDIKSSQNSNNSVRKTKTKTKRKAPTPSATDDDILSLLTSPETVHDSNGLTSMYANPGGNRNTLPQILPIQLPKFDINPVAIQSLSTTPIVATSTTTERKPFKANTRRMKHNSLQCRYCSRVFTKNTSLMDHIDAEHAEMIVNRRLVSNIKPQKRYRDIDWECSQPKKKKRKKKKQRNGDKKKRDKRDALGHNPLECRYCEQVFNANDDLMRHVTSEHSEMLKGSDGEKLKCGECGLILRSFHALHGHMKTHETKRNIKRMEGESEEEDEREESGSESASEYEKKYNVKKQRRKSDEKETKKRKEERVSMEGIRPKSWKKWNGDEDKLLRCEFCTYCTTSTSHLKNHIMVHSGEKPFLCTLCNKRFRQKGHLRSHRKRHHTDDSLID